MSLTTSYFGQRNKPQGKNVAVVRFFPRFCRREEYDWRPEFAPSQDLLMGYKSGSLDWPQYTVIYLHEQRELFRKDQHSFREILERSQQEDLVLCCYERFEGAHTQCHRLLLFDILQKTAKKWEMPVEFIEER